MRDKGQGEGVRQEHVQRASTCKTIVCPGLPILWARAQSILGTPGPLLELGTITAFRTFSLWEMASNAGWLNKGATLLWKHGRHGGSGRLGPWVGEGIQALIE